MSLMTGKVRRGHARSTAHGVEHAQQERSTAERTRDERAKPRLVSPAEFLSERIEDDPAGDQGKGQTEHPGPQVYRRAQKPAEDHAGCVQGPSVAPVQLAMSVIELVIVDEQVRAKGDGPNG